MTVIIGMDPHERSATIEVIDDHARVLTVGRFGTDKPGYAEMLAAGREFQERLWAGRVATVSGDTLRTASSMTAKPSSMCRRSCPRRFGCSPGHRTWSGSRSMTTWS
jgi:hypothetical protein